MTTFTPKSYVGQHGILRELDRSCPRNGRAGARARNRFQKDQTKDEVRNYLPIGIVSQNIKLPPLGRASKEGLGEEFRRARREAPKPAG